MAISQIAPTLGAGSEYDLEAVSTWANTNAFGRDRCSLTEWDTTTVPALAEGSIFETGGAYYQVDSDTAITVGAVSDGFVFILVNTTVPAVPTLQFTNSIPVWDASKFGYYDTATNYKALPFIMLKATSSYTMKGMYDPYGYFLPTSIPMFEAYISSSQYTYTGATNTDHEITNPWTGTNYNYNSCFNTTTGRFTPPFSGNYNIYLNGITTSTTSSQLAIVKNSDTVLDLSYGITTGAQSSMKAPIILNQYLTTSDYISIYYLYFGTASWVTTQLNVIANDELKFSCQKVG